MNKKQAYNLINYLLMEAQDLIDFANFTDIKAVSNLLGTANYIRKCYQLKENEEILHRIHSIREQAYNCIKICEDSLDNLFM